MSDDVPLYQAKAELFRTLGHPIRIRVLELLQDGPKPVHELLAELPVEASNFSQQLAALRRIGLVSSTREGSTVLYSLSNPHVGELLLVGRRILAAMWTDTQGMLTRLRENGELIPAEGPRRRGSSQRRKAGTTARS